MKHVVAPRAAGPSQDFLVAFKVVLSHDLDRRILLELAGVERELRYEELRKAVHEDSKQTFQYAIHRLLDVVLLNRRLEPQGERYQSFLSPSPRAVLMAKILRSLGSKGRLPDSLPANVREQIQSYFAPPVPA